MKLLSLSKGKEHSKTLNAGVLFTLASLEMYDLALTMLGKMHPDEEVTPDTASWLINLVLEVGTHNQQFFAADILHEHAELFLINDGKYTWPRCIDQKWNLEIPVDVRGKLAFSIFDLLLARQLDDWKGRSIDSIVITLSEIWRTEPLARTKYAIGFSLKVILTIYPPELGIYLPDDLVEYYPKPWIIVDDLRSEISGVEWAGGYEGADYARRFKEWVDSGEYSKVDRPRTVAL